MNSPSTGSSVTSEKIRVVHYIWSANFGGIEKLVTDLTRAQLINGKVEPLIVIGCKKGSFIDKLKQMGIPHEYIGMKSGTDFRPSVYEKTCDFFSRADIIHIHTFNPMIYFAAIRSYKKIIFTVHGNFFFGRKKALTDHIIHFLAKKIIPAYTDYITYNSVFSKKTSDRLFKTGSLPGSIIPNGIFLNELKTSGREILPEHATFLTGKFVVGTSSRFVGVKRLDRLIEGFAKFSKDKEDTILLLVGDGLMREQIEQWVDLAGIRSKTLFTGYQQQVRNYQEVMDVCVFPSENEAFGLVVIETLTIGKPTIIFKDAGGMLEILIDEFPEDVVADTEALSQRLEFYYRSSNQEQTQLGEKRQKLASKYDISEMENAFYGTYSEVLFSRTLKATR